MNSVYSKGFSIIQISLISVQPLPRLYILNALSYISISLKSLVSSKNGLEIMPSIKHHESKNSGGICYSYYFFITAGCTTVPGKGKTEIMNGYRTVKNHSGDAHGGAGQGTQCRAYTCCQFFPTSSASVPFHEWGQVRIDLF